jgi:hypothetical protein
MYLANSSKKFALIGEIYKQRLITKDKLIPLTKHKSKSPIVKVNKNINTNKSTVTLPKLGVVSAKLQENILRDLNIRL